jgi:hypothetical protein
LRTECTLSAQCWRHDKQKQKHLGNHAPTMRRGFFYRSRIFSAFARWVCPRGMPPVRPSCFSIDTAPPCHYPFKSMTYRGFSCVHEWTQLDSYHRYRKTHCRIWWQGVYAVLMINPTTGCALCGTPGQCVHALMINQRLDVRQSAMPD